MTDHRVTISPGDAYGEVQLWCTDCWPQWLGPFITGLTVEEVVALDTQADHDKHRAKICEAP